MTRVKLKEQYISYLSLLQTFNNISVIMLLHTFNIISPILDVRRGDYVILLSVRLNVLFNASHFRSYYSLFLSYNRSWGEVGIPLNRFNSPPPNHHHHQYFNTDHSKAVLLLWFLTVTCSCCPYLYFGSPIMLVTYFSKF